LFENYNLYVLLMYLFVYILLFIQITLYKLHYEMYNINNL